MGHRDRFNVLQPTSQKNDQKHGSLFLQNLRSPRVSSQQQSTLDCYFALLRYLLRLCDMIVRVKFQMGSLWVQIVNTQFSRTRYTNANGIRLSPFGTQTFA
jgi:hypothetical protein